MAPVTFYFDCSSPWTYLGFHRFVPLADELGLSVDWRPILVGGVFNAVNPSVYQSRENPVAAKQAYMFKDLQDWARYAGIEIVWPPSIFPINSVKAMRGCIHADRQGRLVPFATAVFEAYWGADRDIADEAVLAELASAAGLDADVLLTAVASPDIKQALRENTDELIARGGFGTPTIFVGDDMYFGNDRLPLIRAALERTAA